MPRGIDMTKPDVIVVRVMLKAPDDPNDSSISTEWRGLLDDWAAANGCEVASISWTRLRKRFVSNPKLTYDELFWDVVERG